MTSQGRAQRAFFLRVIMPIAGLVGAMILILIALVFGVARFQTDVAIGEEEKLAGGAIQASRDLLKKTAVDYGRWDDALTNLVLRPDAAWANDNIGASVFETLKFKMSFVIEPDLSASYAMLRGVSVPDAVPDLLTDGFEALAAERQRLGPDAAITGLLMIGGDPALVALAPIRPHTALMPDTTRDARRLLVFVDVLDADRRAELSMLYGLPGLHVQTPGEAFDASIDLSTPNGAVVRLVWTASKPGDALLDSLLPGLGALLVGFVVLTVFVLRYAASAADLIRTNERKALHDPLTGLSNRLMLFDRLERLLIALSARGARGFCVLCLDLDGFKAINDRFGHDFGDAVLCKVSERLSACLRIEDTISRLGGDEFAILMPGVTDEGQVREVGLRLRSAAREPMEFSGQLVHVDVTIGVSMAPRDSAEATILMKQADIALYAAKRAERGSLRFFGASDPTAPGERRRSDAMTGVLPSMAP